MSVSGYRGVGPADYDVHEPADDGGAADPGPAQSAATSPSSGPVVGEDPRASLLASSLSMQLEDGPKTEAQARIDATLERMSDIEQQLEFLYAYRDMLDEQIADPNTSSWDKLWLKWDRSDVNYEIADLENQLGKLSDELFQQVIESAWDELQDDLSTCIDLGTRDGALAVELSRQRLELDDRGARFREEIARKQKERAENRDYLEKLDGRRPPAPPGTLAAKRELEQILQKMRAVKNPTRADFEAIRDEVKRLRGPSYR